LRFGRDKALEKINGQSLIERAIDRLLPLGQEIIVVSAQEQVSSLTCLLSPYTKTRIVVDYYPGKGPLGGVYTGLKAADTFYNLVVACDMPFLNLALLHYLICLAPGFNVVVPKVGGMLEPLHAAYSKDCLKVMEKSLRMGWFQIAKIFALVKTRYVLDEEVDRFDPEHLSFLNINTAADLQRAKALIIEQNKGSSL